MNKKVMLTGEWHITGTSSDNSEKITMNGTVPGFVHTDLLNNNYIKDPFWRDNDKLCSWIEDWLWSYEKTFAFNKENSFERHYLQFDGIDTYAEITLNGKLIGTTNNMFISYRFDVTDCILNGNNKISVKFSPYKQFVKDKDFEKYPAAFFTSDRLFVRRMQCTFAWDWVPRFISYGLWKNVFITSVEDAEIGDQYIYTHSISDNIATEYIEIETTKYTDKSLNIEVSIAAPDNNIVWSRQMQVYSDKILLQADIRNPQLWWPSGYGEQPLYTLQTTITDTNNVVIDTKTTSFGIRTVKVIQLIDEPESKESQQTAKTREWLKMHNCDNDIANEEPGIGFCVYINNTRIFCRGGNWVPANPFPSTITTEKYDRLIKTAKEGNLNMLRCWGGGIYEDDDFWNACNKYGILVSQDFLMACGTYPHDDKEFIENIKNEAAFAVKKLRNNPSLIFWCGDNECSMSMNFDDPNAIGKDIWEKAIFPALEKYEKSRPYFCASPFGGKINLSLTIGDTHFTNIMTDYTNRDFHDYLESVNYPGRFMSESITFGSPNITTLLKFMTYEDLSNNAMFEYHTKDNPHNPEDYPTMFEQNQEMADKFLGPWNSVEERVQKLEYLQYILIRTALEGCRRNSFYCSGILFWMYNDCWPASGWSMVDYYQIPKAGFYGFKQAAKPVITSLNNTGDCLEIYVCNDSLCPAEGKMNLKVYNFEGEILYSKTESFKTEKNTTEVICKVPCSNLPHLNSNTIVVCDIDGNFETSRAYYYSEMPLNMPLKKAVVTIEKCGNEIKVKTDQYARNVEFYGDGIFSDNYFDLLPGETKTVYFYGDSKEDLKYTWLNK